MLLNLTDILAIADQKQSTVASFNTPSLEALRAAVEAAEKTRQPIILSHAEGHDPIAPLDVIGPCMIELAERSSALICVHLDHCEHLDYMRRALELGFTGVMFDGSLLPYEQNLWQSRHAAAMVSNYDCGLECELGSMGTRENGPGHENDHVSEAVYTDPAQAAEFVEATGCDALACSFGTSHGIYHGEPHLDYQVLKAIAQAVHVPLVMHGGSGVSDEDYRRCVKAGIRKVNYFTYGDKYAGEAATGALRRFEKEQDEDALVYWHDLTQPAYEAFLSDFIHVIEVLVGTE